MKDIYKVCENRYLTKLSTKKPVVIRFDGKNTGSYGIDTNDLTKGAYLYALKETTRELSQKYKDAIIYSQGDEISIVFWDPSEFAQFDFSTFKIVGLFAQEVFAIFNKHYTKNEYIKSDNFELYDMIKTINGEEKIPIYFDTRCFSISNNRFRHYLYSRYRLGINYRITFLFGASGGNMKMLEGMNLKERLSIFKSITGTDYQKLEPEQKHGILGFKGNLIGIDFPLDGPNDPLLKHLFKILNEDKFAEDKTYLKYF